MVNTIFHAVALGAGLVAIVPLIRWLYAFDSRQVNKVPTLWGLLVVIANVLTLFASGRGWLPSLGNSVATISGTLVVAVGVLGYAQLKRRSRERGPQG